MFAFLYAPIAILVLFSFNETSQTAVWRGFTLDWYRKLLANELILGTVRNSLIVGRRGDGRSRRSSARSPRSRWAGTGSAARA